MLTSNVVLGALIALQLLGLACSPPQEAAHAGMEPLPAPTGPHKTGRVSFHWKDAARAELETTKEESRPDEIFAAALSRGGGAGSLEYPRGREARREST